MKPRYSIGSLRGLVAAAPLDPASKETTILDGSLDGKASNQHQLRQTITHELVLLPGYIVAFVMVYSTSLMVPYGFLDSYAVLAEEMQGALRQYDIQLVSYGRPVYALLIHLVFPLLHTIDDLAYLRLAAAISTGFLAWMFYRTLRFVGIRRIYALAIPLLICSTPPYEVFIAWEICAFFPFAAILAGAALLSANHAFNQRASKQGIYFGSAAIALLTTAMMIYQPSAMVFCVFAAILLLGRNLSLKSTAARLGVYCSVLVIALELDYVAAKILPQMLFGTQLVGDRTQFAREPLAKAAWFFQEPLVNALNLWNLLPTVQIALVVAACILVGLFFFLPGNLTERGCKVLIAFALLPLSYLPNLVVQESWASYRTEVALTSLVVLYAGFALVGFVSFALNVQKGPWRVRQGSEKKLQANLVATILVAWVIFGGFSAAKNVSNYFVLPQAEELRVLASQLNATSLANVTSIYVIPCSWSDSIAPLVRYDEFGVASCSADWVPGPMVYLLLHDLDPAKTNIPILVAPSGGAIHPPPGSLVIDMRTLKRYRFADPQYH